ncbi:MAG TPA: alpha/beta hydrolase family protein [Terriglobales bacterium]|nr:alpha/beta hydrolase family protein [Terriglobales bacterium]
MRKRYEQWMYEWETHLTTRDNNRVVRPFEWGLDWACRWPLVNGNFPADESGAERFLHELNRRIIAESDTFFSYVTPGDFRLERRKVERFATGSDREQRNRDVPDETGEFLRFTSPVHTPYPENNLVNARWFPARGRRAVVVMPQWNSDALSHNSLCRMFNLMGIAALRLSMPYHDIRMPAHLERADYAVSANIARTTDAARQAVIDVRACLDWLQQQGYSRLGILGTSLGSCYAFLAAAHDRRVAVNAFNHASTYFADVVWTGQSTRHIRAGIEPALDLDRLRAAWLGISPAAYFEKFTRYPRKSLVIYARYDLTFLPEFSREVVRQFRAHELDFRAIELPCGHYTLGEAPYKFLDGYHIANFFRTTL